MKAKISLWVTVYSMELNFVIKYIVTIILMKRLTPLIVHRSKRRKENSVRYKSNGDIGLPGQVGTCLADRKWRRRKDWGEVTCELILPQAAWSKLTLHGPRAWGEADVKVRGKTSDGGGKRLGKNSFRTPSTFDSPCFSVNFIFDAHVDKIWPKQHPHFMNWHTVMMLKNSLGRNIFSCLLRCWK